MTDVVVRWVMLLFVVLERYSKAIATSCRLFKYLGSGKRLGFCHYRVVVVLPSFGMR